MDPDDVDEMNLDNMDQNGMDLDDLLGGGLGNAAAQGPPTPVPSQMDRAPNASRRTQSDGFDLDDMIANMDESDAQVVANRSISEPPAPLPLSTRRGPDNKVAYAGNPAFSTHNKVNSGSLFANSSASTRGLKPGQTFAQGPSNSNGGSGGTRTNSFRGSSGRNGGKRTNSFRGNGGTSGGKGKGNVRGKAGNVQHLAHQFEARGNPNLNSTVSKTTPKSEPKKHKNTPGGDPPNVLVLSSSAKKELIKKNLRSSIAAQLGQSEGTQQIGGKMELDDWDDVLTLSKKKWQRVKHTRLEFGMAKDKIDCITAPFSIPGWDDIEDAEVTLLDRCTYVNAEAKDSFATYELQTEEWLQATHQEETAYRKDTNLKRRIQEERNPVASNTEGGDSEGEDEKGENVDGDEDEFYHEETAGPNKATEIVPKIVVVEESTLYLTGFTDQLYMCDGCQVQVNEPNGHADDAQRTTQTGEIKEPRHINNLKHKVQLEKGAILIDDIKLMAVMVDEEFWGEAQRAAPDELIRGTPIRGRPIPRGTCAVIQGDCTLRCKRKVYNKFNEQQKCFPKLAVLAHDYGALVSNCVFCRWTTGTSL